MRVVTFESNGIIGVGIKVKEGIIRTNYSNMLDFINAGGEAVETSNNLLKNSEVIKQFRLLAPVQTPSKLLFMGINYLSHLDENPTGKLPTYPHFFSKLPSAIIGPEDSIIMPDPECQLDYEVELAVIIGKKMKKVSREEVASHIFGYTVANDVSARLVQFADNQITTGKGFDTFCPLGPEIVLTDEIPDPSQLQLRAYVNGELRQSSSTDQMLFDVYTAIEFISKHITLYPGDVISTGTPAGVGFFFNPPESYLIPGDIVSIEVDKIGTLTNTVVAGW